MINESAENFSSFLTWFSVGMSKLNKIKDGRYIKPYDNRMVKEIYSKLKAKSKPKTIKVKKPKSKKIIQLKRRIPW